MKRALALIIALGLGILFPLACAENNPSPVKPGPTGGGGIATPSPSGTLTPTFSPTNTITTSPTSTGTLATATPTFTPTPTGVINTPTPTFTPTVTWTFAPLPPYLNNYGTSAAPNGMFYDGVGTLFVAEAESKAGTVVNGMENYSVLGGGSNLSLSNLGNAIASLQATPWILITSTPTPVAVLKNNILLNFPMGIATSSNSFELLDAPPNSSATLYAVNFNVFYPQGDIYGSYEDITNGFGGAVFNNPKALTADSAGRFYVADTGSGYVEEFGGGGAIPPSSPGWLHRWNGSGTGFGASVTFRQPNSLACDSFNDVFIGDSGPYTINGVITSMVQVYTAGGTTLIGAFPLIPGCVVNGLTAAPTSGDFFVSDINNGEIEQYRTVDPTLVGTTTWPPPTGTVYTQAGLRRAWGDPHSYHEFAPYTPSCLQFIGSYIIVGDSGNDFLNIFGGNPGFP